MPTPTEHLSAYTTNLLRQVEDVLFLLSPRSRKSWAISLQLTNFLALEALVAETLPPHSRSSYQFYTFRAGALGEIVSKSATSAECVGIPRGAKIVPRCHSKGG